MFNLKFLRQISAIAIMITATTACTSTSDEQIERVPDLSPQARYQEGKTALNNEMYNRAITILSDLENRYPFGPLARQIQLDLMFAYYKSGQYEQAIPAIDRFISLNPNHIQLDYVIYMRGLVNMATGSNGFQDFFGVESADKDITTTREAFNDFKRLIETYPQSKYNEDAKDRMVQLLDKLARYELVVAKYYMRRAAYVAAINRCKYVVEYYQDSSSFKPALELMAEAYGKLGLDNLKADTESILAEN